VHQDSAIELSIIIVTFNNETEIGVCIEAIAQSEGINECEIIVIDNHSQDRSPEVIQQKFKTIPNERFHSRLIRNSKNIGFTKAINQGLKICRGRYILLLNPDTRVAVGALRTMMQYFEKHQCIGLVAPQLRYPDGEIQASCRRFPHRRDVIFHILGLSYLFPQSQFFNHWKMAGFNHAEQAEVDQPQGACLMTQRAALEDVGLLDEQFPMFFSDVDWCKRFKAKAWRIIFTPEAQVVHRKGSSVHRDRGKMILSSHKSFYDYFRKYERRPMDNGLNFAIGTLLFFTAFVRIGLEWLRKLLYLSRLKISLFIVIAGASEAIS